MKKTSIATKIVCAVVALFCTTTVLFAPAVSHAATTQAGVTCTHTSR